MAATSAVVGSTEARLKPNGLILVDTSRHPLPVVPFVRGLGATEDGFFVIDTRSGFRFVDGNGVATRTVEARPIGHVPTVTAERVFAITEEALLALDLEGTACWQLVGYDLEVFETVGLDDGRLVVTTRLDGIGTVLAIDSDTGTVEWSRSFDGQIGASALGGGLVMISVGKRAMALDAGSGVERWAVDSGFGVSAVAISEGVAYVLDLNTGLVARNLQNGEADWNFDIARGGFFTNLAVGETRIVVVNARFAYGLDLADGALAWTLGEDKRTRFSQPVITDEVVYFFADDRGLVAHDLTTGAERLRVDIPKAARQQGPPLPFGDLVAFFDSTGAMLAYR